MADDHGDEYSVKDAIDCYFDKGFTFTTMLLFLRSIIQLIDFSR